MNTTQDKMSLLLSVLHEREAEKLAKLAFACGEEFDERFIVSAIRNLIKIVPNSVKPVHLVPKETQDSIDSIELNDHYVLITMRDGTRLKTFQSRQQYRNYYYCFRGKLPASFSPESYQACYDIRFRYDNGSKIIEDLICRGFVKSDGSRNFIECGAYNGWKALGFARHLGPDGKIIVVEIDKQQYDLAKDNLEANLDACRFDVLNVGVWNRREERRYSYEHYASHTLKTPDEHNHHTREKVVFTSTLDDIIDESDVEIFDFINIQTGGSELESVQGLDRNLNRVRVMWLGTHYAHDGISIRYRSIDYLLQLGCRIYTARGEITTLEDVDKSTVGGFWAVTPEFRDSIVPRFGRSG